MNAIKPNEPRAFEPRLATLEANVAGIVQHVNGLEKSLRGVSGKIDDIIQAIAHQNAARPASWDKVLDIVRNVGVLIGMGAAAIIWIASTINNADLAVIKYRVSEAPTRGEYPALQYKIESLQYKIESLQYKIEAMHADRRRQLAATMMQTEQGR